MFISISAFSAALHKANYIPHKRRVSLFLLVRNLLPWMVYFAAVNTMKAFVRRGRCWGIGQELAGDKDNSLCLMQGSHVPGLTGRP